MSEKEMNENQEVLLNQSDNQTTEKQEKNKKNTKKKKKADKTSELQKQLQELETKYNELNDKYLRLAAEFDNYKKRTLKEKSDLIKYGGEQVITNLLAILDDFERAYHSISTSNDLESIKEGILLINNKFQEFLKQQGVKEIEAKNTEFNTDLHEAVTRFPANSDEMKGKVIDVIQKGYMLHDKVIRFAKVVVGE